MGNIENLLMDAIRCGDQTNAKSLVAEISDADAKDFYGWTPLMLAAATGCAEFVFLLLERGANPNFQNITKDTCLTCAASQGHSEIVRLLIQYGAWVNTPRYDNQTPLICGVFGGSVESVRLLLDAGADVNAEELWGRTALDFLDFTDKSPDKEIKALLITAGGIAGTG